MVSTDDDRFAAARARIAAQQGRLKGWRPLPVGRDVAVMALEVLGHVRDEPGRLGLRVAVAGRTPEDIERDGERAAEVALRKRAVLGPDDPFVVEGRGRLRGEEAAVRADDPLTWPWRTLTFHAPMERLPAIAGLATDAVPASGE
jgi:hypothetical protein